MSFIYIYIKKKHLHTYLSCIKTKVALKFLNFFFFFFPSENWLDVKGLIQFYQTFCCCCLVLLLFSFLLGLSGFWHKALPVGVCSLECNNNNE